MKINISEYANVPKFSLIIVRIFVSESTAEQGRQGRWIDK